MAVLIYSELAGDKLKLLAEVGEDNVELAVDALLDSEPKLAAQQPFVCFSSDSRMVVEASEEIVRARRDIKISGGSLNGSSGRKQRVTRARQAVSEVAQGEVETEPQAATEAPVRRGPGRPRKTDTAGATATAVKPKRAPKAKAKPKTAAGKAKSPFTRNPASDE